MKTISGKRFCKILENRGWILQRIRGSHHIYVNPSSGAIVTVPVHGNEDLKKGILSQLLKSTGLHEDDC